ncbi:hypothetical protein [Kitasatospora sp. NPDC001132]
MDVGDLPQTVRVALQPPTDRFGGGGRQDIQLAGPLAQAGSVGIGADGVAAARLAGVLVGRGHIGIRVAQSRVPFEHADQVGVGVVEQDHSVASEERGGLLRERLVDGAAFEAGCGRGGGQGTAGSRAGDLLTGGDPLVQASRGVGGGESRLDVEHAVDAAPAAGPVPAGDAGVQDRAHVPVL